MPLNTDPNTVICVGIYLPLFSSLKKTKDGNQIC